MLVPINCIAPDPEAPKWPQGAVEASPAAPALVRPFPGTPGRYLAVTGWRSIAVRQDAGDLDIEVEVREDFTREQVSELQLTEYYTSGIAPPMDLARAIVRHVKRSGVSLVQLARQMDVTPGALHHYVSLVQDLAPPLQNAVGRGRLTFKEARAIADIEDHARQLEVARPFLDGQLSSGDAERIVAMAKEHPSDSVDVLVDRLRSENARKKARLAGLRFPTALARPDEPPIKTTTRRRRRSTCPRSRPPASSTPRSSTPSSCSRWLNGNA